MTFMRAVVTSSLLVCACGPDESSLPDGDEPSCATGPLPDQVLGAGDGVEDRTYSLYVPYDYQCDEPIALVVDFHGTAEGPAPERAYASEYFRALADEHGVIVARPRSRSYEWNGYDLYQWDSHTGDLDRNAQFARNLVADLTERFPIDTDRVYATGFSSGANMVAQFLGDRASPFTGIAAIAGGDWARTAIPMIEEPIQLYLAAGYRDYLWPAARRTAENAQRSGLATDNIFLRRSGGGHEIHAWQIEEAWLFLDEGVRPETGTLAAGWTQEVLDEVADVNAFTVDGTTLVAVGAHGHVWRRGEDEWTTERRRTGNDFVATCFDNGRGFAGGLQTTAVRENEMWMDLPGVPDHGGMLGRAWINGAACRADGSIVVGGYWSSSISTDGGQTWSQFRATTGYGGEAQVAAIATSTSGATVFVGNFYIGRAVAGDLHATAVETPGGWVNGVTSAGTRYWAVADGGQIWASDNDGATWFQQLSGTDEDLYAVSFLDAERGAAVGRNGVVLVTADGGETWSQRPLGLTTTLGAVLIADDRLWIGGQDGLIAHTPL